MSNETNAAAETAKAAAETTAADAKGPAPAEPAKKRRKRSSTSSTQRPPTKRSAGRPSNQSRRAERVQNLYEQLGAMLQFGAVVDPRLFPVGQAIEQSAADLGVAWAAWAETSERVAAMIDKLSFGGGGAAVLLAHLPIVRAVMDVRGNGETGATLGMFSDLLGGNLAGLFGDQDGTPEDATP